MPKKVIDDAMAKLPPQDKVALKQEELVSDCPFINELKCLICMNIVIRPTECKECDALFCSDCITKNRQQGYNRNNDKCPQCKRALTDKPMNRKLKQILID
mmetsp:Transcript_39291/g.59990  ORF Transcript_39291/g.59990 Transcript_39291/m.59990 type:complete len:101 (-) Transcript_39291:611-913(-)